MLWPFMDLFSNLKQTRQRIKESCARAGRNPDEVTLVAVSKGHPPDVVREAVELGQILFGENKVQEAKAKIPLCPSDARWHMIGHLQTNKCRDAVQLFDMIHGVDSLRLAQELDKCAERAARTVPILLEVNIAAESSKFGYDPTRLLEELDEINRLPRVEIHGLMAMAPWSQDSERARPIFRQLRMLRTEAEQRLGAPLPHLSMGMSGDFEIAVEEGATMIRLGTCLFGQRRRTQTRN